MTRMPCRQCADQSPSRRPTPWRGRAAKRWRRGRLELEISAAGIARLVERDYLSQEKQTDKRAVGQVLLDLGARAVRLGQ
jgi:hypothetical protein